MARTRAASRKNLRGTPRQAAAAAVARLRSPSASIEVKNIENFRRRNKNIKITKLLPQSKNIEVKHRCRFVRRTTARQHAIFPGSRRQI